MSYCICHWHLQNKQTNQLISQLGTDNSGVALNCLGHIVFVSNGANIKMSRQLIFQSLLSLTSINSFNCHHICHHWHRQNKQTDQLILQLGTDNSGVAMDRLCHSVFVVGVADIKISRQLIFQLSLSLKLINYFNCLHICQQHC